MISETYFKKIINDKIDVKYYEILWEKMSEHQRLKIIDIIINNSEYYLLMRIFKYLDLYYIKKVLSDNELLGFCIRNSELFKILKEKIKNLTYSEVLKISPYLLDDLNLNKYLESLLNNKSQFNTEISNLLLLDIVPLIAIRHFDILDDEIKIRLITNTSELNEEKITLICNYIINNRDVTLLKLIIKKSRLIYCHPSFII